MCLWDRHFYMLRRRKPQGKTCASHRVQQRHAEDQEPRRCAEKVGQRSHCILFPLCFMAAAASSSVRGLREVTAELIQLRRRHGDNIVLWEGLVRQHKISKGSSGARAGKPEIADYGKTRPGRASVSTQRPLATRNRRLTLMLLELLGFSPKEDLEEVTSITLRATDRRGREALPIRADPRHALLPLVHAEEVPAAAEELGGLQAALQLRPIGPVDDDVHVLRGSPVGSATEMCCLSPHSRAAVVQSASVRVAAKHTVASSPPVPHGCTAAWAVGA